MGMNEAWCTRVLLSPQKRQQFNVVIPLALCLNDLFINRRESLLNPNTVKKMNTQRRDMKRE